MFAPLFDTSFIVAGLLRCGLINGMTYVLFGVPTLHDDVDDVLVWHERGGVFRPFSLVINQNLKTQDRLRQWDVGPSTDLNLLSCPLCVAVPYSHSYFFLECSFFVQIWSRVRVLSSMDIIPPRLADVVSFLIPISKGCSVISIVSRILLAATTYYLLNERNSRFFKKKTSIVPQLFEVIISTVRLKLVTFKFKKVSPIARLLLDEWKILSSSMVQDGSSR
ncbi:hypothetical protein Tco_0706501 [Tanacetum coccineum]|uniref:Reverse transcriptase zinc-binding domain-containing protein n=1 Tax=Tanacetum coccineum TaxID=301880 RepID=A0ABQ4Y9K5_9ASTR